MLEGRCRVVAVGSWQVVAHEGAEQKAVVVGDDQHVYVVVVEGGACLGQVVAGLRVFGRRTTTSWTSLPDSFRIGL